MSATTTTAATLDVLVLAHTHWDREWYHPAGRFRQRLVALVDELLDEPAAPDESFLLDGQAVVLDDYLAVRPERRETLRDALARRALEAGPWYVLADELVPSAEALVRNLLAGRRALALLGADVPPLLYCPDSFGHPAALPELAHGFGFEVVLLWRGYGGRRWPEGDAARWSAPSGASVVLYHLPPDGYEFGSSLPADEAAARDRWERMRAMLEPRARLRLALVQNGADHHARQRERERALAALTRAAAPAAVRRTSLRGLAELVAERARDAPLPAVRGELRDSYGYTWTLQGTFSTRAAQKRSNALVERTLLRESEPWTAVAALGGSRKEPGDAGAALLRAAWRTLLLCHPHDTLCGCSIDEVARAMDARLDDALSQARGVRDDALAALVGHDAETARARRDSWVPALVVRNAAARPRSGVAEVELLTFLQDVPVGPGSGGRPNRGTRRRGAPVSLADVPLQILGRDVRHDRLESPRHYPDDDLVEATRAVAWVGTVSGYGTASYAVEPQGGSGAVLPGDVTPVDVHDASLDNGLLRVSLGADGALSLEAPSLGFALPSLLQFEDLGDAGDLYTHSPVGRPITKSWFLGARVVHRGPLRGELEGRWRLRLPAGRARDEEGEKAVRGGRSSAHVEITITARISLDAASRFARVTLRGANRARDHRLRVVFSTGLRDHEVRADAAFGPLSRLPIDVPPEDRAAELPPRTAPLHRYVTLHGRLAGMTLFSDGLAEYEATGEGDVAVTLVRAVGELSRNDLPERPGHAGWPAPTPEAQSLGAFEAAFALMPHGPLDDAVVDSIERASDDVLLPLTGTTLRSTLRVPEPTPGFELEGRGLAFSAAKPSENGAWVVLRCVNVTEREVRGRWMVAAPIREARQARLDETPGAVLEVRNGRIELVAPPRAVVTVLVR